MRAADVAAYAWLALAARPLRTLLIGLAMTVGVGGVVVLTWLGDAARRFVAQEFQALGTDLLIVLPGRSETTGGAAPPMLGETPRDLTLDDALALRRSRAVRRVAPVVVGSAAVAHGRLDREATVLGSTPDFFAVRHLRLGLGKVWSEDTERAQPVCVLGSTLHRELFGGGRDVLGAWVRVADRRFRVAGVLAPAGRSIGLDIDEMVVLPVVAAQALFDAPGLFRVLVEARDRPAVATAQRDVEAILRARHEGEQDVTVITQEAVLATFDGVLRVLTAAVGGIAAIALVVAGILIMNVMVVAVSERSEEIGLLVALGATPRTVRTVFLAEAALVTTLGALAGLALGQASSWFGHHLFPALEPGAPWWAAAAALAIALCCGLLFGLAPARRAARLDPVAALSRR